ncbi:NmrA family NAD(P)-binding protein [Actinomadura parmotrematis]|uniref:NmrA family NAD(P)-binding protein n=1 Tax=Actinomadura parmotrematis TaxID=2864039 RepID=A0ABS7G0Y0_9ACTN|nr:NmrA family NAD(P)-binding protein [Actinomadura parmotrematis]MBW8485865.1 NmrA family NAD(P)-binding protein [Actinomadura parmotrematis]
MIVVTGPTGNVGAEIVRLLAGEAAPGPYRVAAHDPGRIAREYGEDVPAVAFDYDDRATWPAVLDGVRTLFLLFPLPHPRTVKTRMIPFIDAAVAAGCEHIVYITVPGADRLRFVPHYAVERHIEATGVGHTFLRCGYFSQNLCRAISTHGVDIMDHGEIFIPAGRGRTTFLDARDAAAVALDLLTGPALEGGAAHTLTGPRRLDFDEAAAVLADVLGRPVRYARPSYPRFWRRLRSRGVTRDTLLFMTIVYTLTRTGRNEPLTGELAALLGRDPTPFEQWARDYKDRFEHRAWT